MKENKGGKSKHETKMSNEMFNLRKGDYKNMVINISRH